MSLDIEKIKKRIGDIKEAIEEINKLISMNEKDFWKEKKNIAALKYFLLVAIEALGSICVHICAKKFNKGVSSIGECITFLEKESILSSELSDRLRNMVKFRNILVHQYWDIDDKRVYNYAKYDINDFFDFIEEIRVSIEKNISS